MPLRSLFDELEEEGVEACDEAEDDVDELISTFGTFGSVLGGCTSCGFKVMVDGVGGDCWLFTCC